MSELELDQWVEIPDGTSGGLQRIGRVAQLVLDPGGQVDKFTVWWEAIDPPMMCGQAMEGHYGWHDLRSGFIRPLGILDRLARET